MSYSFRGADSFLAVPGLRIWIDSRYAVETRGDEVLSASDLCGSGINLNARTGTLPRPTFSNKIISSTPQGGLDWLAYSGEFKKFLEGFHEMSGPFSIYFLGKLIKKTGNTSVRFPLFSTNSFSNAEKGVDLFVENTDRIQFTLRNGSGTAARAFRTASGNVATFDEWEYISFVFDGSNYADAASYKIRRGNTLLSAALSGSGSPSPGSISSIRGPHASFTDHELKYGILLVYDWDGYSPIDIELFDFRIRTLLAPAKNEFVNLDV